MGFETEGNEIWMFSYTWCKIVVCISISTEREIDKWEWQKQSPYILNSTLFLGAFVELFK